MLNVTFQQNGLGNVRVLKIHHFETFKKDKGEQFLCVSHCNPGIDGGGLVIAESLLMAIPFSRLGHGLF